FLRPRFRQIYAVREWFPPSDARPEPLGSAFFAFLSPRVPFRPDLPTDVSDFGKSSRFDHELFPSDEQLTQRALWVGLVLAAGWSILALGGALPLYLVGTSCLANDDSSSVYGGALSTLQDLSVLRLLKLLDSGKVDTSHLSVLGRQEVEGGEDYKHVRDRIIVLTVFALVLALPPALYRVVKEFNALVAYRKRWLEVKCNNEELGWLSVRDAPGFADFGENHMKAVLGKNGLSTTLCDPARPDARQRRRTREHYEPQPSVDVHSVFSVVDTQALAFLIDQRDELLEELEIAETRYISAFRPATPEPSMLTDLNPPHELNRPYISRPRPLSGSTRNRRHRREMNKALASSSVGPQSFIAPASFYRIGNLRGMNGGMFEGSMPSFSESVNSRLIGSRFQEMSRTSAMYGQIPVGSRLKVGRSGDLQPADEEMERGEGRSDSPATHVDDGQWPRRYRDGGRMDDVDEADEWHDEVDERGGAYDAASDRSAKSPFFRGAPKEQHSYETTTSTANRETFPMRNQPNADDMPPPHLRLQPAPPFYKPLNPVDNATLAEVYNSIVFYRRELKAINADIMEVQQKGYEDIAAGRNVKGWLMVGRGLRFIPKVQIIEGRAKEDIRWDVLQDERWFLDHLVTWMVVVVVAVLLAAGLTAASGLALSVAPDVAHYLSLLQPILDAPTFGAGLAILLTPAVATTLFLAIALFIVSYATHIRGSVSISGGQLVVFKIVFYLLATFGTLFLTAVGALIFAVGTYNDSSLETARTIADGAIYMTALMVCLVINAAIIFPGLLLLQPFRLWRTLRAQKMAVTPRQVFRAIYPTPFDPSYATAVCILAIMFASTFSLIFPIMAPAATILLFVSLVAHRFLIGYAYGRTQSETGGLLQIWLVKRFGTLLSFQPIFLGLIYLSRELWIEGGVCCGTGLAVIVFMECYAAFKTRRPGRSSLDETTKGSLQTFVDMASRRSDSDKASSPTPPENLNRTSWGSILDVMSLTLGYDPSQNHAVPLRTETLDDLVATDRAARAHPDAPPHLPPLPFNDYAKQIRGILYQPELLAPVPVIWLPNDGGGMARGEAHDLEHYHGLRATIDVRVAENVEAPRRSSS
ncbi:hypothetical protein FISHEDRAFT_38817, partial [Fistulina hepatica ATCC 64428]